MSSTPEHPSAGIDYALVLSIINASPVPHEALRAFVEQEREVVSDPQVVPEEWRARLARTRAIEHPDLEMPDYSDYWRA